MLHKRVQNCQVAIDGVDSNHCAVRMQLNLTLLKYKEKALLNGGERLTGGKYVRRKKRANSTTNIS